MTEYATVKFAGELLCAGMIRYHPGLHIIVSRLPRSQTDQTAGIIAGRDIRPLGTLVPLVRQMLHSVRARDPQHRSLVRVS